MTLPGGPTPVYEHVRSATSPRPPHRADRCRGAPDGGPAAGPCSTLRWGGRPWKAAGRACAVRPGSCAAGSARYLEDSPW